VGGLNDECVCVCGGGGWGGGLEGPVGDVRIVFTGARSQQMFSADNN